MEEIEVKNEYSVFGTLKKKLLQLSILYVHLLTAIVLLRIIFFHNNQSIEKFLIYCFLCFFIVEMFSFCVSGFVHDLITVRFVTIKLHRLSQISRVTFSLSINNRLSKTDEEFSRRVMNKPINNCTLISNFQIQVKKGSDGSVIFQFKAGNQRSS